MSSGLSQDRLEKSLFCCLLLFSWPNHYSTLLSAALVAALSTLSFFLPTQSSFSPHSVFFLSPLSFLFSPQLGGGGDSATRTYSRATEGGGGGTAGEAGGGDCTGAHTAAAPPTPARREGGGDCWGAHTAAAPPPPAHLAPPPLGRTRGGVSRRCGRRRCARPTGPTRGGK